MTTPALMLLDFVLLFVFVWLWIARPDGNPAQMDRLAARVASDRSDPLTRLRAEWLADDRPAFETVDAFERDVERVLKGGRPWDQPRSERNAYATDLRRAGIVSPPADAALVRQAKAREIRRMAQTYGYRPPASIDMCSHRSWTDTRCDDCGTTVPF